MTLIAGEFIAASALREKLAASISNLVALAGLAEKGQIGFLSKYSNSKGAEKLGVTAHPSELMKNKMKELWKTYPESAGLAADRMILAARKEELDSLLVVGSNPITTYPDGQFVHDGFEKLDFLVVADLFETETTAIADVVLPLSSWAEYSGTLVNLEGTMQEFKPALKPVGHSLPAYEIFNRIAAELKSPLYSEAGELDDEIKAIFDMPEDNTLKNDLLEVKFVPEEFDENYPIPLYVIDELHHFGHLTEKSQSLSAFANEAAIEISPALAEKLSVENNTLVRVESEVGKMVLPVKVSELLDNDVALVTRNFSTTPANVLQMRKRRINRVQISRVEEK